MTFKVGDKIRRVATPVRGAPIGFETVVVEPESDVGADRVWYRDRDEDIVHGDINAFELISKGPIRTVTRQEIIPGTYDGVVVMGVDPGGELHVSLIPMATRDPDRLDRAAAVLTALAGALRDAS